MRGSLAVAVARVCRVRRRRRGDGGSRGRPRGWRQRRGGEGDVGAAGAGRRRGGRGGRRGWTAEWTATVRAATSGPGRIYQLTEVVPDECTMRRPGADPSTSERRFSRTWHLVERLVGPELVQSWGTASRGWS